MSAARDTGELARFYTVTDPTTHPKGHTVYKVTARIISRKNPDDVQEITVWKRYSDFKKLHQDLWQIHRNLYGQSELFPPFAKAKVFGRFDDSVIEERRQCSEDLLQFSANIPELYGSQYIQDFFKGGKVQDCSELIGPVEPFSDFLADSLLDSSSEVDEYTVATVEDGMASGCISPELSSSQSVTSLSRVAVESDRKSGAVTFAPSLRNCTGRKDYLEKASEQIALAVQKEVEQEFAAAFSYYRKGVDLLLQGVQGEVSPSRRESVKRKTAEYLMRAELISTQLRDSMGQNSTQNRVLGTQCCGSSWADQAHSDELKHYRVLGVIDKVLLVMDKRTHETFILKGLRKSSECGRIKKTIVPRCVPNMVRLEKFIVSEDSIFLLLQYAEGGKLWSHICKYLHSSSTDDSCDIPFIQRAHTTAVCSASSPPLVGSSSTEYAALHLPPMSSLSLAEHTLTLTQPESASSSEEECTNSYLKLCNEYEQEKLEPDVLGVHNDAEDAEEDSVVVGTPQLNHTHSMMSSDSLCSPISSQELRFFTEEEQSAHSDLFTQSPDCLNHSTPMELFRIDSKDGANVCKQPLVPSDAGVQLTDEPVEKEMLDLWRSDGDRCSNESVPVISFKEAVLEDVNGSCTDEGQPPDLLVNLPMGRGRAVDMLEEELIAGGVTFATGAKTLPTFGRPDVLQRKEEAELDMSVDVATVHQKAAFNKDMFKSDVPEFSDASEVDIPDTQVDSDSDGKNVFFHELDQLAQVALHARIPEGLVRSWAADMIVALDVLHQEGIICRDLNPNNILLNHTGHVELTYFSSWSDVDESCDPDGISKMYCAPEVGGICEETAACDWWSLGALLFELIVGKSLYQCHPAGISRHSSLNIPEFVSSEARSLLEQLLQYNPMERLGAGVAGVEDIKSHPFFSHVNWNN
ncbi:ribosomal protein S6 kinase delta-1 isoform X2 [Myxocyprinus asiaticus]|uniref:ribosomal protein S6 kinase delta-1 isoform X2 n=1 Tax=Myxocyprinus asiaticus TaxID=70543 RepID=UPI002222586F|nr:ribosomal protein S6 kinase delta-1 isoform X2 [Myxocyprinus asiaticus]